MIRILALSLALLFSTIATAQGLEEIVVTAQRSDEGDTPAKFLRRHGDFLLLRVRLTNDSREQQARETEVYSTLRRILSKASAAKSIEVSLITPDDLVVPMTESNYKVRLGRGQRPDTSATSISIKTPITSANMDGQKLINLLRDFVDDVKVEGRTELVVEGDVEISIVGPHQYRDEIVATFAGDVKNVTESLGNNYRVIVEGIDRPVRWYRLSLLDLALYIPYSYVVVPETINSYLSVPAYE